MVPPVVMNDDGNQCSTRHRIHSVLNVLVPLPTSVVYEFAIHSSRGRDGPGGPGARRAIPNGPSRRRDALCVNASLRRVAGWPAVRPKIREPNQWVYLSASKRRGPPVGLAMRLLRSLPAPAGQFRTANRTTWYASSSCARGGGPKTEDDDNCPCPGPARLPGPGPDAPTGRAAPVGPTRHPDESRLPHAPIPMRSYGRPQWWISVSFS